MNKPMKIVWICHFNNPGLIRLLNVKRPRAVFAEWMPHFIDPFLDDPAYELHIIVPFYEISIYRKVSDKNVHYHLFNDNIPFTTKQLPFSLNYRMNFIFTKIFTCLLINYINPAIVHLFGAENAYYSSIVLTLKKSRIPVFISIQGFASLNFPDKSIVLKKRIEVEQRIFNTFKYFGVSLNFSKNVVSALNPGALFYFHNFPKTMPVADAETDPLKEYDCIYFARIDKEKGIEDLIQAAGLLVRNHPAIKIAVIGSGAKEYLNGLKQQVTDFGLESNFIFLGFLPGQADVHKEVRKAKAVVLPTHNDLMPGTIIESMLLRVPVVTYAVGGISELNQNGQCLFMAPAKDIVALATAIERVLKNDGNVSEVVERAYNTALAHVDYGKIKEDLITAYSEILTLEGIG